MKIIKNVHFHRLNVRQIPSQTTFSLNKKKGSFLIYVLNIIIKNH